MPPITRSCDRLLPPSSPWKSEPPVTARPSCAARCRYFSWSALGVVRVVDLERVEAAARPGGNLVVTAAHPGMRQRGEPAGGVDLADRLQRRNPGARDERRLPLSEQPIEGVLHRLGPSGVDESPGHGRPADRGAGTAGQVVEERTDVDRGPGVGQGAADGRHALDPAAPLGVEEGEEAGVLVVHPIAEDVDVAAGPHRRHFDAGHEGQPGGLGRCRRLAVRGDGVVVGHREHAHAGLAHSLHEVRRAAPAVGRGRVQVQIDHEAGRDLRAAGGRAGAARRVRLTAWRRVTSARYSRIRSSRCSRSSSANSRKICLPSESSNRSP